MRKGLWKQRKWWSLEGRCGRVSDWECDGAEAIKGEPIANPQTHTVVMTLREPERKRSIFFLSAWEALIFTKTLAGPAGAPPPALPPGPEAAVAATSCCGHTRPPLPSESLEAELKAGDSPSLALDSLSP